MENIMMKEYQENFSGIRIDMVAIFNKACISENEVKKVILSGISDDRVITVSKEQYDNVFGMGDEA